MNDIVDVYAEIRKRCAIAGGQSAWAGRYGLSPQYVSDVLNTRRDPGPKILAALGFVRRISYHRSKEA